MDSEYIDYSDWTLETNRSNENGGSLSGEKSNYIIQFKLNSITTHPTQPNSIHSYPARHGTARHGTARHGILFLAIGLFVVLIAADILE